MNKSNTFLENKLLIAVDALEKVVDPRKIGHSEPDLYTRLGCLGDIANKALEAIGKKTISIIKEKRISKYQHDSHTSYLTTCCGHYFIGLNHSPIREKACRGDEMLLECVNCGTLTFEDESYLLNKFRKNRLASEVKLK